MYVSLMSEQPSYTTSYNQIQFIFNPTRSSIKPVAFVFQLFLSKNSDTVLWQKLYKD